MPAEIEAPTLSPGTPMARSASLVLPKSLAASAAPKRSFASALSATPAEFCDHSWLPVAVRPEALPGMTWTTP